MITRQDYMKNSSELHHAYYMQFVTEETKRFVLNRIGMNKLIRSDCKHFNDIIKHSNNGLGGWIWDYSPVNMELVYQLNETKIGCLPSLSFYTCVGKACARWLVEQHKTNGV